MPYTILTYLVHTDVPNWNFTEKEAAILRAERPDCRVVICPTEENFVQNLPEADAVLTWTFKQAWFDHAPKLKYLSTPAAGKDYFHVTPPQNITMLYGHFHGEIIAETVVGMLLALIRGIAPALTTYADCPWPRWELSPRLHPLRGSHVTILGFGHIGRWIGRLLKPFGVTLAGMTRHADAPRPAYFTQDDFIFTSERLDDVLKTTDHLVLALPSDTGTDNLLNAARLKCLPPHATVVNIGRGNAIDETALANALNADELAAAFLDVFKKEPLPANAPIRRAKNLWILPHASAIAENYLSLYTREVAQELIF